jgi:hypothetical protein
MGLNGMGLNGMGLNGMGLNGMGLNGMGLNFAFVCIVTPLPGGACGYCKRCFSETIVLFQGRFASTILWWVLLNMSLWGYSCVNLVCRVCNFRYVGVWVAGPFCISLLINKF